MDTRRTFSVNNRTLHYHSLPALEEAGIGRMDRLPFSIRVLLENLLRNRDGELITDEDVKQMANWQPRYQTKQPLAWFPSRVVMQDFTGVPGVVDLAAMRDAMASLGGDPAKVNPVVPVDLIIDHSVQVDYFGTPDAYEKNLKREYERNEERYKLLKWAQRAFDNVRIFPPGAGIVHQVNLEYIASVVDERLVNGELQAFPDTLIGTDSHTTMINGIGVLGWGVGGIEAEAVMLGQPYNMTVPEVVGVRMTGSLREGVTTTDLVLTVTERLRQHKVVEKFVEFFGQGVKALTLPDRATLGNMSPEYGATCAFFPVDEQVITYLKLTNREEAARRVEAYMKEQNLFFRGDETPDYTEVVNINLDEIVPSVAGPARPQDRVSIPDLPESFRASREKIRSGDRKTVSFPYKDDTASLSDGSVVIAAITSCTNTSNPAVMVGAGLLAKKAVKKGLTVPSTVKTSLAPGSRVVTAYLEEAGLMPYLEQLGYNIVGYGCTTCIGNSGPLPGDIRDQVKEHDLVVTSVLSGNRNFEARINPDVKANYLASPPLVIAYALAGRMDIDLTSEPIGTVNGNDVFLSDIWPTSEEIQAVIRQIITPQMFADKYAGITDGDNLWQDLPVPEGSTFAWDPDSTYIRKPPFVQRDATPDTDIENARILLLVRDSVTTDHISPAGAIPPDYPAGRYLKEHGVRPLEFNSYGSRRGNHEVMMRGTFANVRIKNQLVAPKEGGFTRKLPEGEETYIFDAAMKYQNEQRPLVVLAGREYGTGSSRDWAAKGTSLLGIQAVIAQSYERIHRSNLVGMGVLPLEFMDGDSAEKLGLNGIEQISIHGLHDLKTGGTLNVSATRPDHTASFEVRVRLDTDVELRYYRAGGILPYVLNQM